MNYGRVFIPDLIQLRNMCFFSTPRIENLRAVVIEFFACTKLKNSFEVEFSTLVMMFYSFWQVFVFSAIRCKND